MKSVEVAGLAKSFQIHRAGETPARSLIDEFGRFGRELGRRLRGDNTGSETFWALQDVDFEIAAGSAVGLIGSNGSGKSTLLKILSRITPPTHGHFRLAGRVSSLLEVGTGFHPELTSRQNIFLNGAILGMRRKEIARQLDEIVDFAGVAQFLDEPVKHLSSGMYTRLAFSVAAFLQSEVLLVDEVLAVGDAAFQQKCLRTMQDAASSGRTVIFVSHNMAAVAQLTRQTLVLDQGRLTFSGATADAIGFYLRGKRNESFPRRVPCSDVRCQERYRTVDDPVIEELGPAEGQPGEIAPGGAIRLEFLIRAQRRHSGIRLNYTINSVTGQPLLSGHSAEFPVEPGSQLVELQVDDIRLVPGEYQWSIYLGAGGWHEPRREFDMFIGFGRLTVGNLTSDSRPFGDWDRNWAPAYHTTSQVRRRAFADP